MNLIYLKKLFSLNPTRYTTIPLAKALEGYHFYCECFIDHIQSRNISYKKLENPKTDRLKTFEQWLKTEI